MIWISRRSPGWVKGNHLFVGGCHPHIDFSCALASKVSVSCLYVWDLHGPEHSSLCSSNGKEMDGYISVVLMYDFAESRTNMTTG